MRGLLDTIRSLGAVRVAILAGVTLGLIAAFVWLELGGMAPARTALLAGDLDPRAVQQLSDDLTAHHVPFRIDGSRVFVADGDLTAARALRAGTDAGGDGTTGYEIFDRGNDFGMTDFDQQVKLTRALEGELARTIVSVPGISRARVHLVLPRREPFSHDTQHAQASVMLMVPGHRILSPEAVQSVVNLVAAGVPGLRPKDVTLVDSNLHLLYQGGDGSDARSQTIMQDDLRQRTENRLAQAVELMLEPTLGPGHVHAEASIRMNFDKVNETDEKYDPDGQVVRSTQNVTSNSKTADKAGPVSLQNNLPNADAGATVTGTQEGRQEETTNYEIGKTVRAIVHDTPQIERISLAVMVDGNETAGADGKMVWKPRDQAELDRIGALVKSAVGFDEKRGDRLDIASMPFVATEDTPATTPAKRPGGSGDLPRFLQLLAFGVVGFGIIILTARSIFAALKKPGAALSVAPGSTPEITGSVAGTAAIGSDSGPGEQAALMAPEGEAAVMLNNIAGQMRASSIRKVAQLVDQHPETTLGIIRGWLASDAE